MGDGGLVAAKPLGEDGSELKTLSLSKGSKGLPAILFLPDNFLVVFFLLDFETVRLFDLFLH